MNPKWYMKAEGQMIEGDLAAGADQRAEQIDDHPLSQRELV
jgi:hypothetical protein